MVWVKKRILYIYDISYGIFPSVIDQNIIHLSVMCSVYVWYIKSWYSGDTVCSQSSVVKWLQPTSKEFKKNKKKRKPIQKKQNPIQTSIRKKQKKKNKKKQKKTKKKTIF